MFYYVITYLYSSQFKEGILTDPPPPKKKRKIKYLIYYFFCRTLSLSQYFFIATICDWNVLPDNVKQLFDPILNSKIKY